MGKRKRTTKAKALNRTALARAYGVSLGTVDSWVRRGCPHERCEGRYVFRLDQVAPWRAAALSEDSHRRNFNGRRPIPDGARDWLDALMMGYAQPFWWHVDRAKDAEPDPEVELMAKRIVTADEYRDHYDLDGDEILFRVLYGLPLLPPAPDDPKQRIRISLPHAQVWHFLFSGCIETLGGDGMAKRIAMEAQRLRGYPTYPAGKEADEREPAEEASP